MKKRKKIILLSMSGIIAVLIPLLLIAQFGNDPTNYQEDYINSIEPIPTRKLKFDVNGENVKVFNEENTDFKILQLSDVHFVGAKFGKNLDLKALKAVYEMVNYVRPDIIIYTGDIVYPMRLFGSNDNIKAATVLSSFFEKMQVPFLYEFGNHDTEVFASGTEKDINEIFQANPYCYAQEDSAVELKHGRLSQVFEIRNHDNTLNNAIFLMDSGSYWDNTSFLSGYSNFNPITVYWYVHKLNNLKAQEGFKNYSDISSLAFFHIPPYEYKQAFELYEQESDEVTYLFGQNDEGISCPNYTSGMFDKMVSYESTRAIFFGHDHMNSLALKYQGIDFYYGHSIDYRAYPTIKYKDDYRGGLIISIKPDSSYEVKPQLLKDILKEGN
ncbi:MAG: metallophosphoesterase [Erysipelotrichales bacterium]|nr:metallophosphoesterase [Erysipelotrichales bacterium]